MEEFKYEERYGHPVSACLNLTDACNLACRYCFVEQNPHFMSLDMAKQGVKWIIDNLHWQKEHDYMSKGKKASIIYFGGEPMLLFEEIIKPLTIWGKETFPNELEWSMTTNGTLLNEERLKFLNDNNIHILLSIDGDKETQDFNRPCQNKNLSSFDLVNNNIPLILKYYPNTTFRSTISKEKSNLVFENYIFAIEKGFKNIFMIPNSHEDWSLEQLMNLDEGYKKIYYFMLDLFRNNKLPLIHCGPIEDSFEQVLLHDITVKTGEVNNWKDISRNIWRCGIGTTGCSIGYDGTIYGCQEQTSRSDSNIFKIGHLPEGIVKDQHEFFLKKYTDLNTIYCSNKKLCDDCEMRIICKTACPSTSWTTYKDFFTNGVSYCVWRQIKFNYAKQLMNILVAENNETFKEYLNSWCNYNNYFIKE